MTDRRRINGPVGGTFPPVFAGEETEAPVQTLTGRTRPSNTARPVCECSHIRVFSFGAVQLTRIHSPQDWGHTFSFRLRIPGSPDISKTWCLWSQAQLHRSWTQSTAKVDPVLTAHHSHHSRQIRALCNKAKTKLREGFHRTRSQHSPRDSHAGRHHCGPVA